MIGGGTITSTALGGIAFSNTNNLNIELDETKKKLKKSEELNAQLKNTLENKFKNEYMEIANNEEFFWVMILMI